MLHSVVQQFMRDVAWGDWTTWWWTFRRAPATWRSPSRRASVAGPVLVTTPGGSVADVRKAMAMFRQLNISMLGVVENMSYFVCGHCNERTEIFGPGRGSNGRGAAASLLGEVPIDTRVAAAETRARRAWPQCPTRPPLEAFADGWQGRGPGVGAGVARPLRVIQTA